MYVYIRGYAVAASYASILENFGFVSLVAETLFYLLTFKNSRRSLIEIMSREESCKNLVRYYIIIPVGQTKSVLSSFFFNFQESSVNVGSFCWLFLLKRGLLVSVINTSLLSWSTGTPTPVNLSTIFSATVNFDKNPGLKLKKIK